MAKRWLEDFCERRLSRFGTYQDAVSRRHFCLFHALIASSLNIGLLTPAQVLEAVDEAGRCQRLPFNQREGFVRQLIGWREYVRALYVLKGGEQRSANFFGHERRLPQAFYNAGTGIPPLDDVIAKLLKTGYAHHIERLMILGNFMLLCEISPTDVYTWFMEMFIDSYDWVMVPNVYGMSQFADGGLMMTKPYVSSSNYLLKMSDYPKGDWCRIWDGLFWRFLDRHREFFQNNPRTRLMAGHLHRMEDSTLKRHIRTAEDFLRGLA